jgi:Cu-Zn family superoxide dismutase
MRILLAVVVALGLAAQAWAADAPVTAAIAVIQPTQGHTAHGAVRFEQAGENTVKVIADLEGLPPSKDLGFHIHQYGDISAPDATSAGGHYNPQSHPHAGPESAEHHAGDFGNISSDAQGKAHKEMTVQGISIAGPTNPILGRAVIIHAQADDLKSQPTGNAGARIGAGVIGVAAPPAAH